MFDAPTEPTATTRRTRRKLMTAPVTPQPVTAPVVKPTRSPKPATTKPAPVKGSELKRWAYCGVAGTLALSGWLNGLAFSESAPTPAHGWVLGIAIPVLLLVFSRVSALCLTAGRKHIAAAGAVACLSMLALSVQHCAHSISKLTGEPVALAALMALAIDAGLVVCELATIGKK